MVKNHKKSSDILKHFVVVVVAHTILLLNIKVNKLMELLSKWLWHSWSRVVASELQGSAVRFQSSTFFLNVNCIEKTIKRLELVQM